MDHSDLDRQIELLRRCETIKESEVKALCSKAREILVEESNVQRVDSPVTVRAREMSRLSASKLNQFLVITLHAVWFQQVAVQCWILIKMWRSLRN